MKNVLQIEMQNFELLLTTYTLLYYYFHLYKNSEVVLWSAGSLTYEWYVSRLIAAVLELNKYNFFC